MVISHSDKTNGMMFNLAKDCLLYHRILGKKGDTIKAKEYLNKAINHFKECGSDGWVKMAENELDELS